jgi:hypothetical protein
MRSLILAVTAFAALAAFSSSPAAAFFDDYNLPFCLTGGQDYPGMKDCSYPTYAACLTTASGRGSYCIANPFVAPYDPSSAPRHTRRHRGAAY